MNKLRSIKLFFIECLTALLATLPNDRFTCELRRFTYNYLGFNFDYKVRIFRNVLLLGNIKIGKNSSVSNNCSLNGSELGIVIGEDVMIAPGCCIVAFTHGVSMHKPMREQKLIDAKIVIGNNVWIGANCTVIAGVCIEDGAIIAANSIVTKMLKEILS